MSQRSPSLAGAMDSTLCAGWLRRRRRNCERVGRWWRSCWSGSVASGPRCLRMRCQPRRRVVSPSMVENARWSRTLGSRSVCSQRNGGAAMSFFERLKSGGRDAKDELAKGMTPPAADEAAHKVTPPASDELAQKITPVATDELAQERVGQKVAP